MRAATTRTAIPRTRSRNRRTFVSFAPPRSHPRNAFQGSYDIPKLCDAYPKLRDFVVYAPHRPTIDFSNPHAVRALNTALLFCDYQVTMWDLPNDSLIPPIPGRADYIHSIADVLQSSGGGGTKILPVGPHLRGLDIGTGASLIYPLLGSSLYRWSFTGTDVSCESLQAAQRIATANRRQDTIELRHQPHQEHVLQNVIQPHEEFDFVMCNPPFYPTQQAFEWASQRKIKNLRTNRAKRRSPVVTTSLSTTMGASSNCSGQSHELWYPGGEVNFLSIMMQESRSFGRQCLWFSALVSRRWHVPRLQRTLPPHAQEVRVVAMGQGNKSATILFWSFLDGTQQRQWCERRWKQ